VVAQERLLLDYVIPAAFSFSGNSKATVKLAEELVESVALLMPEAQPEAVAEAPAEAEVAIAKHVEQVSGTFRPDMAPLIVDAPPAETIRQLAASSDLAAVADALRVQAMSHIGGLHRNIAAVATIAKLSTEGVCCAADMDSWMTPPPSRLLTAYSRILPDIPFLTSNGTLFEMVVEPPVVQVAEGSIDEDVKAKLFRAYCHVEGPSYGNAHEFSYGNRCRRCGYTDEEVVETQGDLFEIIVEVEKVGCTAPYITQMLQRATEAAGAVQRAMSIRNTQFIKAGYALMTILVAVVLILLVIADFPSEVAQWTVCGALSLVYTYLLLLVRDLDNPFGYGDNNGRGSGADVDLSPFTSALDLLKRPVE
jgi:hypothetical protein